MNEYIHLFKVFDLPSTKKIIQKKEESYCDSCDVLKRLDTTNYFYICVQCGEVSGELSCKIFNNLKPNNGEKMNYVFNYCRSAHFKKKIKNSLPMIPPDLRRQLCSMFNVIESPFKQICYDTRKNFIRYDYIIMKFLEILGEDHYIQFLKPLKSDLTVYRYDQIFKKICLQVNFPFKQSVCLLCIIEGFKKI